MVAFRRSVFSPNGSRLYVTTPGTTSITVIDPTSNTVIDTFAVPGPAGLAITPDGTRLYSVNANLNSVSVVDALTGAVTLPVGMGGNQIAISPNGLKAYVTNTNANTVTVLALDTAPTIVTTSLPNGSTTAPYSAQIQATGSPAPQFSVTAGSLPAGLTLNSITGAITGTPQTAGAYAFDVTASATVSGLALTATRSYAVTVAGVGGNGPSTGGGGLASTGLDGVAVTVLSAALALGGGLLAAIAATALRRRRRAFR